MNQSFPGDVAVEPEYTAILDERLDLVSSHMPTHSVVSCTRQMTTRSRGGRETWRRLRDWDRGQSDAERLAGQLLRYEGFSSIDPSHPLGGPDRLKDIVCVKGTERWIGAAYFSRGEKSPNEVKKKVEHDSEGVSRNDAVGMAFVTNQEISLSHRQQLSEVVAPHKLDLFHLERIASILDSPPCYGIRLEFLDIEMSREEQVAFIATRDHALAQMRATITRLSQQFEQKQGGQNRPQAALPPVRPTFIVDGIFGFGPFLHTCSACNGVYKVNRLSFGGAMVLPGSTAVITCPYCGKMEKYPG